MGAAICRAQTSPALAQVLNFEAPHTANCPAGWYCNPPETIFADNQTVHSGKWAVRLERAYDSPGPFSTITKSLPVEFGGKTIELRGYVRTDDVRDFAGLWLREDGDAGPLESASMQDKEPAKGTTPWTEYSISLPVNVTAKTLVFGFLLSGAGRAWVDDLCLLVDGKPLWKALKPEKEKTPLDTDREFDGGSHISLSELTSRQIAHLVVLGRVWGFLKYRHPTVTSGQRNFDYDLFRIIPAILAARDDVSAEKVLVHWIDELGPVKPCTDCKTPDPPREIEIEPDLKWIDEVELGTDLARSLSNLLRYHPGSRPAEQFYVAAVPAVGNPLFKHESAYSNIHLPDAGFQILALFRFWNIIEYWYPYRTVIGEDWPQVLKDFLPKIALAKDQKDYELQIMALVARVHDSHANLSNAFSDYPPGGNCATPSTIRFVENQAVVAGFSSEDAADSSGLTVGDVIEQVDGIAVSKLVNNWQPYYGASNQSAFLRSVAGSLTRGDCGKLAALRIRRGDRELDVNVVRVPFEAADAVTKTHDAAGDTFRLISKDVAYLKLSSVKGAEAAHYIESAQHTKGLVIDIRNYPSEFVVFALGQHLVSKPTPFARLTVGDLMNPGQFHWGAMESLIPAEPHYKGKIVILVDEVSQSQSEYTAMAFRSAPNAIVMGSTTAGADGNVSQIALPGGLSTMISGIGVYYPDKKPTQRVGIVPDVRLMPTVAGIRAGRDEVLEAAVRYIEGSH